jgi:hypothetical protein
VIRRRLYPKLDLIVHTVIGELGEDEFRTAVIALYELDPPPRLSLWDFSGASVLHFTLDRTRAVQSDLVGKTRRREGGKTAAVAPSDFTFAKGRQYAMLAESFNLPFEHRIFRTIAEAWVWLGIDADQLDHTESRDLSS